MSLKSSRIAALVATATTVALLGVTAAPALAKGGDIIVPFTNWTVSGSITAKKLNQAITLPSGSSFNGQADLTLGTVTGTISVPSFTASVTILGLPSKVGLKIVPTGPATGTIVSDPNTVGDLDLSIVAQQNLDVTSIGLFGLTIPTNCTTTSPMSLDLSDVIAESDLSSGATFTGTTTVPSAKCSGALGGLVGPILTALLSGPNNPFSISIAPPATASS
jgi:hypothetical protein